MTMEDAVSLLQTKTTVKPYVLEMLHYGYEIPLEDIIQMSNIDASEILENFNKEFVNVTQKITDAKITWHHDKDLHKRRFGDKDPYANESNEITEAGHFLPNNIKI